ncbi:polymorphic toxin type 44 domain-containing protein [Pseudomonas frederiksbergensis]|uniref:polymorphic toxin type 44 domain-containing protein n=1 Tax=Pseudomonas frederiksbergensis TaxID=104087 RepID=UPI001F3231DE|nr:polymorphic toxin type 44 domain-containing protein [Pseudomonas frederiksbergensis]
MAVAFHKKNVLKAGSAFIYSWFYTQVRNRGPWDYKQLSAEYEAFENFNYGATGTAAGFSEDVLLRAAGLAQSRAGSTAAEFGTWWGRAFRRRSGRSTMDQGGDKICQVQKLLKSPPISLSYVHCLPLPWLASVGCVSSLGTCPN